MIRFQSVEREAFGPADSPYGAFSKRCVIAPGLLRLMCFEARKRLDEAGFQQYSGLRTSASKAKAVIDLPGIDVLRYCKDHARMEVDEMSRTPSSVIRGIKISHRC